MKSYNISGLYYNYSAIDSTITTIYIIVRKVSNSYYINSLLEIYLVIYEF